MTTEIILERVNNNDSGALLGEWLVPDLGQVTEGQVIVVCETSKAAFEVEAPVAGFVRHAFPEGATVAFGATLGWVSDTLRELDNLGPKESVSSTEPQATAKAKRMARDLDIDLADIKAPGIIREVDVRNHVNQWVSAGMSTPQTEPPEGTRIRAGHSVQGEVQQSFLDMVENDPAFSFRPSDEKVAIYREHGALIGDGVRFARNSVLIASHIIIGRDAEIGENTRIKCETFELGRMGIVGPSADVLTRTVRLGDVFYSGSDILIGGGGAWNKDAHLTTGHSCLVSSGCILNTGHGITLGDRVGLSPHVKIYTHNHWQNVLEGYHSNFGPIHIADDAYITGDCLVVPGVRIGKGATVMANSTVVGNVGERALVTGNPAKEVGRTEPLSQERKERIVKRLVEEMRVELKDKMDAERLSSIPSEVGAEGFIVLALEFVFQPSPHTVIFDLNSYTITGTQDKDTDEVRNFLRKRGIRFSPIHWRYTGDTGLFNQ